jgi:glutamate/tyrosine decarboxylase-like PLP-dependent enzyme
MDIEHLLRGLYPYADKYGIVKTFPEKGLSREEILDQIDYMATKEDATWEDGSVSGTMYCGDHSHYDFLNKVSARYSHVNSIQRDICLSMSRFESEIIAMTLDMMHGAAVKDHHPDESPCGAVGSGGTESILNAMLVYRDKAKAERGITQPELIMPDTAHAAFVKAGHLFNIKIVLAPVDPESTLVDIDFVKANINDNTVTLVGSAGNYPYGTIDPISELSEIALEHNIGLHVDGCLGGFILPWGEALGYDIPIFDFRLPGVTSMSADSHKYGYGLKGTSVVLYRDKSFRQHQYFAWPQWKGGAYASSGLPGSRSGGIIAATWASMISLGKEGYLKYAKDIFETAFKMQDAVKSHPELKLMGKPTWCFSFTGEGVNIFHVNDFMVKHGWRFNGQQNPGAIHMCVTRPQTLEGVADRFVADLAEAVEYAKNPPKPEPDSGGIYGGGAAGLDMDDPEVVRMFLYGAMDAMSEYPF